jgi:hypothetical protein
MLKPTLSLASCQKISDKESRVTMNTHQDLERRERRRSPQTRAITMIFIILFTVMCYFLAQSMMRHRFTEGARYQKQSHQ